MRHPEDFHLDKKIISKAATAFALSVEKRVYDGKHWAASII